MYWQRLYGDGSSSSGWGCGGYGGCIGGYRYSGCSLHGMVMVVVVVDGAVVDMDDCDVAGFIVLLLILMYW